MIRSLNITNFQSHADTSLDLAPGLNIVVGSSNSGKSAILRALNWLVNNRPSGDSFIRQGEKDCSVEVGLDDGTAVERFRKPGTNAYGVRHPTGASDYMEATGRDVPDVVSALLNLGELNIQGQVELPFLILDAPGKIARALNDVVHLDKAEGAANAVSSRLRDLVARAKVVDETVERLECDLRRFNGLPQYKLQVEAIRLSWTSLERSGGILDGLRQAVMDLRAAEADLAGVFIPSNLVDAVRLAEDMVEDLADRQKDLSDLRSLADDLHYAIHDYREVQVPKGLAEALEDALFLADAVSAKKRGADSLNTIIDGLLAAGDACLAASAESSGAAAEYNGSLADLSECPACGQELDGTAREHLLKGQP